MAFALAAIVQVCAPSEIMDGTSGVLEKVVFWGAPLEVMPRLML